MSIILGALAAMAVAADQQSLRLVCPGTMFSSETSRGTGSSLVNGQFVSSNVSVNTPVSIQGTAKLAFDGATGTMTYPDGAKRNLTNVVWTDETITAKYRRLLYTYNVVVSRLTGEIEVKMLIYPEFRGACEPAPPEPVGPKF